MAAAAGQGAVFPPLGRAVGRWRRRYGRRHEVGRRAVVERPRRGRIPDAGGGRPVAGGAPERSGEVGGFGRGEARASGERPGPVAERGAVMGGDGKRHGAPVGGRRGRSGDVERRARWAWKRRWGTTFPRSGPGQRRLTPGSGRRMSAGRGSGGAWSCGKGRSHWSWKAGSARRPGQSTGWPSPWAHGGLLALFVTYTYSAVRLQPATRTSRG